MKANELMQEDIVLYEYDGQKFLARIVEIYRNSVLVESINGEYEPIEIKDDKIFPVGLTQEILEKSGFNDCGLCVAGIRKFRWHSEDGRTEISIWFDDTTPMEIVKNVYYEDEVSYSLPFPWSVNLLQHALRLCGIEKEIIL